MMNYQPPPNGFRTFLVVWATQSVSVFGSALTFFAMTIWLMQVLYPRPEQKPELGLALSAMSLAFALPTVFGAPIAGAVVSLVSVMAILPVNGAAPEEAPAGHAAE